MQYHLNAFCIAVFAPQELRLCLGDADLSSLCLPSLRTSLTTLHLHLKGLTYGLELPAQSASQHGTGLAVLSHLTALSHFSCEAPSYTLSSNVGDGSLRMPCAPSALTPACADTQAVDAHLAGPVSLCCLLAPA